MSAINWPIAGQYSALVLSVFNLLAQSHVYIKYQPTVCNTVKPVFFACPLFREFRKPGKFTKMTGRENLNTVAFQCNRKQKRQNYGVQNNYIDSNAKIKGSTVFEDSCIYY